LAFFVSRISASPNFPTNRRQQHPQRATATNPRRNALRASRNNTNASRTRTSSQSRSKKTRHFDVRQWATRTPDEPKPALNMATIANGYTPLEDNLLFHSLTTYGADPSAFRLISTDLLENPLICSAETYDRNRLLPEALHEHYLLTIKEAEAEDGAIDGVVDGKTPIPPAAPTRDQTLIYKLAERSSKRYQEAAIKEIHDEEARYFQVQRKLKEITAGLWDERLLQAHKERTAAQAQEEEESEQEQEEELRRPSPSPVESVGRKTPVEAVGRKSTFSPVVEIPVKRQATPGVPVRAEQKAPPQPVAPPQTAAPAPPVPAPEPITVEPPKETEPSPPVVAPPKETAPEPAPAVRAPSPPKLWDVLPPKPASPAPQPIAKAPSPVSEPVQAPVVPPAPAPEALPPAEALPPPAVPVPPVPTVEAILERPPQPQPPVPQLPAVTARVERPDGMTLEWRNFCMEKGLMRPLQIHIFTMSVKLARSILVRLPCILTQQ
jgi:hypothetical protein